MALVTSVFYSHVMQLIAQYFIEFSRRESYRSYIAPMSAASSTGNNNESLLL
jgi:hypothetical protein